LKKIVHLTSAHPRDDIRIFHKECISLASVFFDVHIVVSDGKGDECTSGVSIHDVGACTGRLNRILYAPNRVFSKAMELNADLYHIHDPELLKIALRLKRLGKKVIFDAHEDFAKQIIGKPYLNALVRWVLSKSFSIFEKFYFNRLDGVIAATPSINLKYINLGLRCVNINNFPLLGELDTQTSWKEKAREVCYVGGVSAIRGINELIEAMEKVQDGVRLNLCGNFSEIDVEKKSRAMPGWRNVNDLGFISRIKLSHVLGSSMAGLVTFLPLPNHIEAQPNKMFEYMSAGLPVIASNFPLWREIVLGNNCGLCIDPRNPIEITQAINFIVNNPNEARVMGENGKRAVSERYNWSIEEKKLYLFYSEILEV
jgi:glycosyltransferase involved in cell wall biosynthesis